ncbi:IS3 family transposase [Nocardia sp. KC 131]|uniref:IS3 family transposase n=1 Tax=Nocardia arseniciresistens TaxID=3392119 RepID=UPI00398ED3F1
MTRHQRGFTCVHPSGLPLARLLPRTERRPLGFFPELRTRDRQDLPTHVRAGIDLEHWSRATRLAQPASYREAHSHTRLRVAQHEHYYRHVYAMESELVASVDNWIDWYSNHRRHSAIGMLSPVRYEQSLTVAAHAA